MKKLNNEKMNEAFAEAEYMDYMIVAAIFSEPVDTSNLWWGRDAPDNPKPPMVVNKDLNKWESGLIMVLVGLRSDSTISVYFKLKDDDSWECLTPKELRDEICLRSLYQSAARPTEAL